jgi:hypothetical protein
LLARWRGFLTHLSCISNAAIFPIARRGHGTQVSHIAESCGDGSILVVG